MKYTIYIETFYPKQEIISYDAKTIEAAYIISKELITKYGTHYDQIDSLQTFKSLITNTDGPLRIYFDFDTQIYLISKKESNT